MLSMMSYHLNKHVLVSIPEIPNDGAPLRCRLLGVESFGLWLESEALSRIAFSNDEPPLAMVFVPFSQISYLVGAPQRRHPPRLLIRLQNRRRDGDGPRQSCPSPS